MEGLGIANKFSDLLQVMVSNAGNVAMDGVVRDLVYNPYPEFTAFFVGDWLLFQILAIVLS